MPADAVILISTFWIGTLVGVSFIATPVKFLVPDLTRPVALAVGRLTFRYFSRIEWFLAILLLGVELVLPGAHWHLSLAGGVGGIVALQSIWLLPVLDRRVVTIIGGGAVEPSHVHRTYGALEATKLIALVTLIATSTAH